MIDLQSKQNVRSVIAFIDLVNPDEDDAYDVLAHIVRESQLKDYWKGYIAGRWHQWNCSYSPAEIKDELLKILTMEKVS